jgi:hypothetical protein
VFEADIKACFDEIDHTALMGRVRHRTGDKRVLDLVKAFLTAGILTEDGNARATITGTLQGGILSPLLANMALSVLDEHFARKWEGTTGMIEAQRSFRRVRGHTQIFDLIAAVGRATNPVTPHQLRSIYCLSNTRLTSPLQQQAGHPR